MTTLTGHSSRVNEVCRVAGPAATGGWFADLMQLIKPRVTLMVVGVAWVGYAMGSVPGSVGVWPGWRLWLTLIGTAMACMGSSVLNQVLERDTDAKMHRTCRRPIPAGRVSVSRATALGVGLCTAGVGLLLVTVNALAAWLTAVSVLGYVGVYTPLKRVSSVSTIIGAVPGALPPVIGYAAAAGRLGVEAWLMFGVLFLWQLPHFLAIAWLWRDDYRRAGMAMLSVIDPGGQSTFRQVLLGSMALLPLGLLPSLLGVSGVVYLIGSLLAGGVFLGFGIALVIGKTRRHARALFWVSLVYLPLVYALLLIDRA